MRLTVAPMSHCWNAVPLWERACSRMRCLIQQRYCLTRPLRERARSHRFCSVTTTVAARNALVMA